jgi:hypothetical protein
MRWIRHVPLAMVAVLFSGCVVEHGTLDFADPLFDLRLGSAAIICFPSSTVFRYGGTYLIVSVPWYLLIAGVVILATAIGVMIRKRRHE